MDIHDRTTQRNNLGAGEQKSTKRLSPLGEKTDWGTLRGLIDEASKAGDEVSIYDELQAIDLRYLREDTVNSGGMKTILRTEDKATGRAMAMAVLKQDTDLSSVENFLREARITAHLEHPNIVPVYDIGLDKECQPFFTMKLLSGENLRQIIEKLKVRDAVYRAKYPLTELVDIFMKVCDAVAYAHDAGIIHLDLKPSNIQVSDHGEVLVCDWGLAKIIDSDCESPSSLLDDTSLYNSCINYLTVDGFFKGTPGFMSPEQTRGPQSRKDQRTDVYSLGAILYTILALQDPIEGNDIDDIIEKTRQGEIAAPRLRSKRDKSVPVSLEAIVMKALRTDPSDRYQTVEEMIADIDSYRNGFATMAEGAGFLTQLRLLIARNPKVSTTIAVTSLLVTGITAYTTQQARKAQKEAENNFAALEKSTAALRAEREWRSQKEAAPDYFNRARDNFQRFNLAQALEQVRICLDFDPNLYRAWELKGQIHFAFMEFAQANAAFRKAENDDGKIWADYCEKFMKLPKKEGRLTVNQILKIVRDLRSQRKSLAALHMVRYYAGYEMANNQRIELSRGLMLSYANNANNFNFKYKETLKGFELDLSNNKELVRTEFLTGLPINTLNLSNSQVRDLTPLRGMHLDTLDLTASRGLSTLNDITGMQVDNLTIAGTEINRIEALRGMNIKRLDVSKMRRLTADQLRFLSENCIIETLILTKARYEKDEKLMQTLAQSMIIENRS